MKFAFSRKHIKQNAGRAPKSGLLHHIGRDPFIDWALIFSVAALVALILVCVGVVTFIGVDMSPVAGADDTASSTAYKIDTKSLQKILNAYDVQQGLRSNLIHGYAGPGDPSI